MSLVLGHETVEQIEPSWKPSYWSSNLPVALFRLWRVAQLWHHLHRSAHSEMFA